MTFYGQLDSINDEFVLADCGLIERSTYLYASTALKPRHFFSRTDPRALHVRWIEARIKTISTTRGEPRTIRASTRTEAVVAACGLPRIGVDRVPARPTI
jgi:hypothetical protein